MINRHSIVVKLNFIFVVTLFCVSIIFFFIHDFASKKSYMDLEFSLEGLDRLFELYTKQTHLLDFEHYIYSNKFEIVVDTRMVLNNAKEIDRGFFHKHIKPPFFQKDEKKKFYSPPHKKLSNNIHVLVFKDNLYVHLSSIENDILLKFNQHSYRQMVLIIRVGYIFFIGIFILLYLLIRKNLNGLKDLQKSLIDYEHGLIDKTKVYTAKDEVSLVSKQFYELSIKLEQMNQTRKLFLRNMMHELKTPLTKSKMYLSLIKESDLRSAMEISLQKLELLIDDMANIEKISTDNIVITKKEYRLIDIIDNAKDMLFLEAQHVLVDDALKCNIGVDFNLFTIVIKNLIDNAIKYSNDSLVYIDCEEQKIYFSSYGDKLNYDFKHYLEPFFKGDLNDINQRGFGLGLYIANEILLKHGFKFSYEYMDGKNIFAIHY